MLVMFFALSSSRHVLKHYLKSFKSGIVYAEKGVEGEKDTSDKSEKDTKDENEHFTSGFDFDPYTIVKRQLESLHLENVKLFIIIPLSPPPEHTFA